MRDEQNEDVTPVPSPTNENEGQDGMPEQEQNDAPMTEDVTAQQVENTLVADPSAPDESLPQPNDSTVTPELPSTPEQPLSEQPVTEETEPAAPLVAVPAPAFEPMKKSKKPLIIGLITAGVAAVLIGGSAFAYNFWYQNPDKVVSDAIVNAITAKSVSATGSLEVKTDDYRFTIKASGKTSPDANSQIGVKLSYSADDVNVTVDGEAIYSAEGDIFVKLQDIKKLTTTIEEQSNGQISFEIFGGVIEKVDSKWVKIGKEDLGDFSEDFEKTQKCFADISKQLEEDSAFRREVENETKELYQNNKFIIVGEKLGSRTVNGQGSLGYLLSTDPEVADAFFTGLADTQLGKKFLECDDTIKFEDVVNEDAKKDDGTETHAEIWVSRFGHYITEVNLHGVEDGTDASIVINPVFNKDETVEIPTDAIPFSEVKADIEKAFEDYAASYYDSYYDTEVTTTQFN